MDDRDILQIKETDRVSATNLYKLHSDSEIITTEKSDKRWPSLSSFFMDAFLPYGYPHTVSKDYLQYQVWDSVQAFASSITGSICTHAILKGAGVGDINASPLAATITWLIKDGTSMAGRILFAWHKGTKLDCDCKKWRLFADVMNDLAMLLDLLTAYFQNHFMILVCVSGVIKSVVGVAGGSTRAALTQHQARKHNMADVSAKDGSQETLVNLLALICSLVLIPVVTKSFVLTWITYICMTIVHLTANYFAVRSVVMETFNTERFKIFSKHYFSNESSVSNLLSVYEVNRSESVFFSIHSKETVIRLGCSFKEFIKGKSFKEIQNVLLLYKDCDYMLTCIPKTNSSNVLINVVLNEKATSSTEMEAMYQACFLDYMLKNRNMYSSKDGNDLTYALTASRDYTRKTFSDFLNNVQRKGFNTNIAYFNVENWRIYW